MTPEQIEQIKQIIREEMSGMLGNTFSKDIKISDDRDIQTGTNKGTKFPKTATQKWGAFGVTPIVQPVPSLQNGITEGAGTTLNNNSTSTGGLGSSVYRFSEIVRALKDLGLIAQ